MFSTTVDRERAVIEEEGLDALISFSPENVAYAAGYMIPSQYIPIRKRVFATLVTPDSSVMVVAPVEINEAKANSRISDIRSYNEFADDPMAVVAEVARELGIERGRLGVEIDFLPGRYWMSLQTHLSRAKLLDAEDVLSRMRSIKTAEEVEQLRRIAGIVNDVHESLVEIVQPGWTEKQIASRIIQQIIEDGGDGISLLVIGSGERSVYANCPPTERTVREGDTMRVDIFAHLNRYMSDIARTYVVGAPEAKQKDIWKKLCVAESSLAEWIRPGANTRDVMAKFLKLFDEMGLTSEINFVGHSLGLTLHEEPFFNLESDHEIREGMVFAIEPVHFEGEWGFHLEDEVLVTADGCEFLSDGRSELREIRVRSSIKEGG